MESKQTSSTELEHSVTSNITESFVSLLGFLIVIIAAVFVLLHAFEFICDVLKTIFKFCEFIWHVLKTIANLCEAIWVVLKNIAKLCVCCICVMYMWWLLSLCHAVDLEEKICLMGLCYTIDSLWSSKKVQRLLFALFCGCMLIASIYLTGTNAIAEYLLFCLFFSYFIYLGLFNLKVP